MSQAQHSRRGRDFCCPPPLCLINTFKGLEVPHPLPPHTLWGGPCSTQPTDLDANLFWKHPLQSTNNNV